MRRAKLIAAVVSLILAVIIVLQNTTLVEARILFLPITMSLALLLILTFVLGLLTGVLVTTHLWRKKPGQS